MGSSVSKATRKYPTKVPSVDKVYRPVKDLGSYKLDESAAARNRPSPHIEQQKTQESDGRDPQFLEMLRQAGPVKYNQSKAPDLTAPQKKAPTELMFEQRRKLNLESKEVENHPERARKTLEISEIVALLEARKRGSSDAAIIKQFNLDESVLARLGKNINTATETDEKDEHGNVKGVWRDRI